MAQNHGSRVNEPDSKQRALNQLAAQGFTQGSIYDAGRPSYSGDAVNFLVASLGIGPGCRVADIGAGTGKFTEKLLGCGAEVVAIEPSPDMRRTFTQRHSDVEMLAGTGERIPLPDNSCDAVVVAQAFHWFEPRQSLREITRVLTATGRLGLIWNERDESESWVAALSEAMQWTTRQPYRVGTDFSEVVRANSDFCFVERRRFHFAEEMDHVRLRQRVLSTSYISAAPAAERDEIMSQVDRIIDTLPVRVAMPYVADTYVCSRTSFAESVVEAS